jgi:hypothetical protein
LLHNLSLAKTSRDPEPFYFVLRDIPLCRRSRDRLTGNDTALCALGVRYKFSILREKKNGFLAPKRHQIKHLDFLILWLESRQSMSPKGTEEVGSIPTAPTSFSSSLVRTCQFREWAEVGNNNKRFSGRLGSSQILRNGRQADQANSKDLKKVACLLCPVSPLWPS